MLRLNSLRIRADQRGFALIELLVTMVILGVLAAIAIPQYMGHKQKGQDSEAKANVRNLAAHVELCFAPNENFTDCDEEDDLEPVTGLVWGDQPGEVRVTDATDTTYTIEAVSKAKSDGTQHTFVMKRNINGSVLRTCSSGGGNANGGCRSGVW